MICLLLVNVMDYLVFLIYKYICFFIFLEFVNKLVKMIISLNTPNLYQIFIYMLMILIK